MKNKKEVTGSCLCGQIKFSLKIKLDDVWICHCSGCRKNYGVYGMFIGVSKEYFNINEFENLKEYKSSNNVTRTFCDICGSSIYWSKDDEDNVYLLAGLIDDKFKFSNAKHIFTEDKGNYYDLCDNWPKYKDIPE